MTLKISIGPATEAKLRKRAAEAGKDAEDFAVEVLEESLSSLDESMDQEVSLAPNQRVTQLLKWIESHRPAGYQADDSRESIYGSRGQ